MKKKTSYKRTFEHLGELEKNLRDLKGFTTLAYELIQNADDAPGTSTLTFDIQPEALVVDNDGVFTDCRQMEEDICPWKRTKGRMCDFHRFRKIGSADKRNEEGAGGAFGIGFTTVYQITDRPELISAGRHWIVFEEKQEVDECAGCPRCQNGEPLPGTRFILPWVRDPESVLRSALKVEAVTDETPARILREFTAAMPTALLFLKKVRSVEIKHDGEQLTLFERSAERDGRVTITGGPDPTTWHLLHGRFEAEARRLRKERFPGLIESKRDDRVTLAIPEHPFRSGLFFALLPTKKETGLPFHLQADFYPMSHRKEIVLEGEVDKEYQSEWNRAAIRAAAETLAAQLLALRERLGHQHLWALIKAVQDVARAADQGRREATLAHFWKKLVPPLQQQPLVFCLQESWHRAGDALQLQSNEDPVATSLLDALLTKSGRRLVHPDLRPYYSVLIDSEVGVKVLTANHLAEALSAWGLTKRTAHSALPEPLQPEASREALWQQVQRLLAERPGASEVLAPCAIAPSCDDAWWPCQDLYRAEQATVTLFSSIDPAIPFLDRDPEAEPFASLCPRFTVADAVELLASIDRDTLVTAWKEQRFTATQLLSWFAGRWSDYKDDEPLQEQLRALPIFPSASGLYPLSALALPGNFTDPLGLADLLDLGALEGRRQFLKDLGAKPLTFRSYASDHLPGALKDERVPVEKKRAAVRLLAEHIGEIQDDDDVREALAAAPLVECQDGAFREPGDVYFDAPETRQVLGGAAAFAFLPKDHQKAAEDLYEWLGVARQPRFADLLTRIKEITSTPPGPDAKKQVAAVFAHLAQRIRDDEEGEAARKALKPLKHKAWLPTDGDDTSWHQPGDVYAVFQRHLFETQVTFLDVPRSVQQEAKELLGMLGIKSAPTIDQVVKHLLACIEAKQTVNKEVYRTLNDNAQHRAIRLLQNTRCLLLPSGTYVAPDRVFWGAHPFRKFRHQLGRDLRSYQGLFARLGVKDAPNHEDARDVLEEIAVKYGEENLRLDDDAYDVVMNCWRMMERAIEDEVLEEEALENLKDKKVIPNQQRLLQPPSWVFFEDRAGLAERFGDFFAGNVLTRQQGAWRAMAAAGVRMLSEAVTTHVAEAGDPADNPTVPKLVRERITELLRVLDAYHADQGAQPDLSAVQRVHYQTVKHLTIYYAADAYDQHRQVGPEAVPAHYSTTDETLFFVPRAGAPPWAAVARELAMLLYPSAEPGGLAAAIKDVLDAPSLEAARATLDELGFPPLEAPALEEEWTGDVIETLGGDMPPEEPSASAQPSGMPSTNGARADEPSGERAQTDRETQRSDGERPGQPDREPAMPSSTASSSSTPGAPAEEAPRDEDFEPGKGGAQPLSSRGSPRPPKRAGRSQPRSSSSQGRRREGRYGTYVQGTDPGDPTASSIRARDDDGGDVEEAAISRVLAYEKRHDRSAEDVNETRANNPGYDVISRDASGNPLRYIEVKGCGGAWGSAGVGVSAPQFNEARRRGEEFWLYVVEHAEDDNAYCLYAIQNPALKVDTFFYDGGWKNLAEECYPADSCSS